MTRRRNRLDGGTHVLRAAPEEARDVGARGVRRRALVAVVPVLGAGLLATWVVATGSSSSSGAPGHAAAKDSCSRSGSSLSVAAAPAIADAIRRVASTGPCRVRVEPADPATVMAGLARGSVRPDVWIPDSSTWMNRAEASGLTAPRSSQSVATSPVVLAVPKGAAALLGGADRANGLDAILASRLGDHPVTVAMPDPGRSMDAAGALLALRSAAAVRPDARAALTWVMRSGSSHLPAAGHDLLSRLVQQPTTVVPSSEQEVLAFDRTHRASASVQYFGADGARLDYPFLVLAPESRSRARDLLAALTSARGQRILAQQGFRDADGHPGAAITTDTRFRSWSHAGRWTPQVAALDEVSQMWDAGNRGSRLLAVLDVSGSMGSQVPGTRGATRLELTKQAAARGLGLYTDRSRIGLWTFSTDLSPDSDHVQLVPVGRLGARPGGGSGRALLRAALAGTEPVPNGGTGLYDTVLAAVRSMQATWDPSRTNSVLVLTDGHNDDTDSVSLPALLRSLRAERRSGRPVSVVSIAFGPGSDAAALRRISAAAGGTAYPARDPRAIGDIFLDAIGQRLCSPFC